MLLLIVLFVVCGCSLLWPRGLLLVSLLSFVVGIALALVVALNTRWRCLSCVVCCCLLSVVVVMCRCCCCVLFLLLVILCCCYVLCVGVGVGCVLILLFYG